MKKLFLLMVLFALIVSFAPQEYPVIYMIGDSTMANKNISGDKPERGWGQMLPGFLDARIKVDNRALNGRSSKSFRDEGRWQYVMDNMKKGDYVFIQFGHNDEKTKAELYSDPEGSFLENLKRYITETRDKGAIPVLFTSIARRNFNEKNELVDTHGKYIDAVFVVGKEMGVPVIDMNKSTTALLKSMPVEESKKFFMWIPKATIIGVPNGAQDNTHLNVYGGRVVAGLAVDEIEKTIPELAPFIKRYDFVVAKDGSGDFMSVQHAIDAVPDVRANTTTIYIRNGEYKEKLKLPASKQHVKLVGEDKFKTILTYDDYASKKNIFGENMGTSGSASFYIYGAGFMAENITFENSAVQASQAVAVYAEGDRMVFKNCRFIGNQDTLYTHGGTSRQYYENCYIEGTVDFIFGWSVAVFKDCTIHSKRSGSYITAASTNADSEYGYLFLNCKLTADDRVEKVFLGRPWRAYAKTVFIGCEMGKHITPEGWHNWSKPDAEKTSFYAEYGNRGDGAKTDKRVKWSHQLSKKEADSYTPEKILSGTDGWDPKDENFRPKNK